MYLFLPFDKDEKIDKGGNKLRRLYQESFQRKMEKNCLIVKTTSQPFLSIESSLTEIFVRISVLLCFAM